jgi:hypothetical protein
MRAGLGGFAGGQFRGLEVGGTDEEDVSFLAALKSLHGVYVVDYAVTFCADVEVFEQGFDNDSAADWAGERLAGHGI